MLTRIMTVTTVALLLAQPSITSAQVPFPSSVADSVANCMTAALGDDLRGPASVESIPDGWRVVLPLRGHGPQPEAQTPLPSEDTLAWVDLIRYDSLAAVPQDSINNITSKLFFLQGGAMALHHAGYFYFGLSNVSSPCTELATGGTFMRL